MTNVIYPIDPTIFPEAGDGDGWIEIAVNLIEEELRRGKIFESALADVFEGILALYAFAHLRPGDPALLNDPLDQTTRKRAVSSLARLDVSFAEVRQAAQVLGANDNSPPRPVGAA